MSIREHIQRSSLGAEVVLFELDLTIFGEGVLRFTSATENSSAIQFGGVNYSPYPIVASGFEVTTDGPLPQPTLTVANVTGLFNALVEQHNDLEGAVLRRIRTYERFLDNGPDPDPTATRPPDVYELSQKTHHDNESIQWRCVSQIDQEGVTLPNRKIVRDYCGHQTRTWDGTQFVYTNATCPYTGPAKDENGVACLPEDEVFSKRLSTCCEARFGRGNLLPTRAFPGVARVRNR